MSRGPVICISLFILEYLLQNPASAAAKGGQKSKENNKLNGGDISYSSTPRSV